MTFIMYNHSGAEIRAKPIYVKHFKLRPGLSFEQATNFTMARDNIIVLAIRVYCCPLATPLESTSGGPQKVIVNHFQTHCSPSRGNAWNIGSAQVSNHTL